MNTDSVKLIQGTRSLVVFLLLLLAALTPEPVPASELPELGRDASTIISPHREREIGEEAMIQIRQSLDFINDPELDDYLQRLGNKLTHALPKRSFRFRFFLIANPSINAFALPGGFIGVYTGLVASARSESELAAILAHEISHVSQRHWPRMVSAQKDRAGVTLAAVLASLVIAGSGNPNGTGIAIAAMASNVDSELTYTRAFEREADRIGIRLLAEAGYDVTAMADFFEKLEEENRYAGANIPGFMRTHPVTTERIAEARGSEKRFSRHKTLSTDAFWHFRARTRALYDPDTRGALANLKKELADRNTGAGQRRAARYGIVLALTKRGEYRAARKELDLLLKKAPANPRYRVALADIELGARNTAKGLDLYQQLHKDNPRSTWLTQRYSRILIANNQAVTAKRILKPAVRREPHHANLNRLLATAAGETGDLIQAHRSMAEYYVINGNPRAAIHQLVIAEKKAQGNFYALAAIQARKREIQILVTNSTPRN